MENQRLKVSRQKTDYMCTGDDERERKVEEKEIVKRIQLGWGALRRITGVMCDQRVLLKVKGKVYMKLMRSAVLWYGDNSSNY